MHRFFAIIFTFIFLTLQAAPVFTLLFEVDGPEFFLADISGEEEDSQSEKEVDFELLVKAPIAFTENKDLAYWQQEALFGEFLFAAADFHSNYSPPPEA